MYVSPTDPQTIYSGYDASWTYTVPDNAWFLITIEAGASSLVLFNLNGRAYDSVENNLRRFWLPIRKGAIVGFTQSGNTHAATLVKL